MLYTLITIFEKYYIIKISLQIFLQLFFFVNYYDLKLLKQVKNKFSTNLNFETQFFFKYPIFDCNLYQTKST